MELIHRLLPYRDLAPCRRFVPALVVPFLRDWFVDVRVVPEFSLLAIASPLPPVCRLNSTLDPLKAHTSND